VARPEQYRRCGPLQRRSSTGLAGERRLTWEGTITADRSPPVPFSEVIN
jgi:hypothetical protein